MQKAKAATIDLTKTPPKREGQPYPSTRSHRSKEANRGIYSTTSYCYNSQCPSRTKERPWPASDSKIKGGKEVCAHCQKPMRVTFSGEDFA